MINKNIVSTITSLLTKPAVKDRIIIFLLAACFFIPFLGSVHLFDWDELNFAEAAREMVVTKNYMRVQIDFQPFWEKPPFFIWLQAISMKIFGINEFAARFVNAACGIITLLVVYAIGKILYDRLFGMLWALTFLGSSLPHFFFKSGIIDPVFNLFIFLGIYFLSRTTVVEKERGYRNHLVAGLFIGIAVLTKGPVAGIIACLCWAVYVISRRTWKMVSPIAVVAFIGAICFVSFVFYGIETLMHGTWFVREFIKYQFDLLTTSQAGHGRPFYFHFFVLLFGCFPASALAIRSFFVKTDGNPQQADFKRWMSILFWVVLILFSIVKTKTVLYSSLTYFPITFLAVWHIHAVTRGKLEWNRLQSSLLITFGILISAALFILPLLFIFKETLLLPYIKDKFAYGNIAKDVEWPGIAYLAGIVYLCAVLFPLFLILRKKYKKGFITLFISCAIAIQVSMKVFTGRIENHTQRGPIEFYKSLAEKDCYVKSLYKSYAPFFYSDRQPLENPHGYRKKWLLLGRIDKPAYFVCRNNKARKYAEKYNLTELKSEGGFVYFKREPFRKKEEQGNNNEE